jgi:IMP cyclohydrolase
MNNPNGPYPGRQLFLGMTVEKKPCLAYLVTGRSKESRERRAIPFENTIRMGPLGDIPYDPLRHYTALKYDNAGIAAISNGIQTEAVFEMYKLLANVNSPLTPDYMVKIMDGANAEPDSYHTPRIAGVIIAGSQPVFIIGLKGFEKPAAGTKVEPAAGTLIGVSTYQGNMDNPAATDPTAKLSQLKFEGKTPEELAKFIFDISAAAYKGDDIRVCSIGLIRSVDNTKWEMAFINAHQG